MATAKRKQEELGDGDGDCSETIDSDAESIDLGDSSRKRCRMDEWITTTLTPTPTIPPIRFSENNKISWKSNEINF